MLGVVRFVEAPGENSPLDAHVSLTPTTFQASFH